MQVTVNLIPLGPIGVKKKIRRPGFSRTPNGIIVHSTANPKSTALNERNWLVNPNNFLAASWNEAIDEKGVVVAIPYNEVSNGTLSRESNWNDIQVEICESGDRELTLQNAIDRIADLCITHNIQITKVRQHADVQAKNCPRILRDTNRWNWFISEIQRAIDAKSSLVEWLKKTGIEFSESYWANLLSQPVASIPAQNVKILLTRLSKRFII